jgi:threonine dehydrogenase-like Zn-dependent dehydrogenase
MYQKKDFEIAVEMIAEGKIKLGGLITHTFPFSQYHEAYRHIELARDRAIKVMISL